MSRSPRLPASSIKLYIEAVTGSRHRYRTDRLDSTLFSQGYVPPWDGGNSVQSKHREGSKEAPTAQVQFLGQLVVCPLNYFPQQLVHRTR